MYFIECSYPQVIIENTTVNNHTLINIALCKAITKNYINKAHVIVFNDVGVWYYPDEKSRDIDFNSIPRGIVQ